MSNNLDKLSDDFLYMAQNNDDLELLKLLYVCYFQFVKAIDTLSTVMLHIFLKNHGKISKNMDLCDVLYA